jgi:putative transposase
VRLRENRPRNSQKRINAMALDQSALLELNEMMQSADGGELMRRLLGVMLQALVDAEATAFIGAEPHERNETRITQRNGGRDKVVTTTAGDLTVKIPKVRTGSFFPALLAPRRRIDVALHAVVMQAWVEGVSTRRVDDLVVAMGGTGISKSEVSRICAKLDAEVAAWRSRPLDDQPFPYVFLDATYCKVRIGQRVVSQAVVIATGVSADGRREVLGCAVGDSETEVFWTEFLRDLRDRGLRGVQLVISDAHSGLVNAVGAVLQGSSWQRCRVHFMRNALAKVNKGNAEMVAATIRTIFAQPGPKEVRAQVDLVADMLAEQFPAVADLLRDAKADLTAFADFPQAHWRKIWSTNPLERLNREVKRRADVVGIFPNPASLLRLSACVLIEAHDEWQDQDRRYLSEESMALLNPPEPTVLEPNKTPPARTSRKEIAATA